MANYFQCEYIHSNENICFIQELESDYKSNVKKLIDRVVSAFIQLDCKYVIWLEDDVFVNKRLPTEYNYDINGFSPNSFNKKSIECLSNFGLNAEKDYRFSGHGGSVYNCDKFLDTMKRKELIDYILDNWSDLYLPSNVCQDVLFSLLISCNGGEIGSFDGHIDSYEYNPFCTIQHQYKRYYNMPLPHDLQDMITSL